MKQSKVLKSKHNREDAYESAVTRLFEQGAGDTGSIPGLENDPIAKAISGIEKGVRDKAGMTPDDENQDANAADAPAEQDAATNATPEMPPAPENITSAPKKPPEPDDFIKSQVGYFALLYKGKDEEYAQYLAGMQQINPALMTPYRQKFISDNMSIATLLLEAPVSEFADKFRPKAKKADSFSSVWAEMSVNLERKELAEVMYKLGRLGTAKSDMGRKFIAALCSGAQVGTGAAGPDVLIPTAKDGSGFWLSVRVASNWEGYVPLANWTLRKDDLDLYLSDSERQRLETGSPEERAVVRKRLVIESIAAAMGDHETLVIVSKPDGTWDELCFALGPFLKDGFAQGVFTVVEINDDDSGANVTADGTFTDTIRFGVAFVEHPAEPLNGPEAYPSNEANDPTPEEEQQGPEEPEGEWPNPSLTPYGPSEEPGVFIEQRGDQLVLKLNDASVQTLASGTGIYFSRRVFQADYVTMQKSGQCFPDARDVLFKRC